MQERRFARDSQALLRRNMKEGMTALQQGNMQEAQAIFTDLLDVQPDLAPAHVGMGRVFAKSGDPHRALEHFQEAQAIKPDNVQAQVFAAQMLEKLGETEEAMAEYETAIALEPTSSSAYIRLSRMKSKAGAEAEALTLLREAVMHNPQDTRLRMALASALRRSGDAEGAASEMARVSDLKPDAWMPYFRLGRMQAKDGDLEGARDALSRAATLAPDKAVVHQALGQVQTKLEDHGQAVRSYDRALAAKNNGEQSRGKLRATLRAAQARAKVGRHREALDMLLNLGPRARKMGVIQKAMGDIYLETERPSEAVDCYRAAILNAPKMKEKAPDLVKIAEAELPEDVAAFAELLRTRLAEQGAALAEAREDNGGSRLRERRAARREDRMAG